MKKILALALALIMVMALFAGCKPADSDDTTPPETTDAPAETTASTEEPVVERDTIDSYTYGVDYMSLYEALGDQIGIDDVYEIDGLAYAEVDGVEYELGMDFLSMAMVYKCEPEGTSYATADDIYNMWWKLYMQRWNYLATEVPLYSNQYFHVFNSKLQNYSVSPYWGAADALPLASIDETKGSNSIILGSTTDLSGSFRYASFGKNSPGSSDMDIQDMTTGLATVDTDITGAYAWSSTVVAEHSEVYNEDGSKTFTIKINDDLKFSDGSPITAKNYLVFTLAFGTPVVTEAASRDAMAGMSYVGFEDYHAATDEAVPFSGLRLIDEYTFSVTVDASYLPYYYDITYAAFSPYYLPLWIDDCDIADDGEGAYITGDWYEKNGESYVKAAYVAEAYKDITTYPYSGPYTVTEWDASALSATLSINPNFKGNRDGIKPSIETISYVKMVAETQNEQLKAGQIDILSDITGGADTDAALAIVEEAPDKFSSTYYDRAGYGKLGYRATFGPVYFTEVRQAIMYVIDRNAFAQTFTGGYGAVVHGAYYTGSAAYLANEDSILLNQYAVSEASAIAVLEEGGWIYNADGTPYSGSGVRYKKLAKSDLTEDNLAYQSLDGTYKTVEVNGDYYMPLAINWFCTTDNDVSEMLKTAWAGSELTTNVGMNVQYTQGDFNTLLAEYGQDEAAGYTGPALYSAFNFATGFTSTVYDFAFNWTINPDLFDTYTYFGIMDEADYYWMDQQ